jgi:hypothetical protein
MKLHIAALIAFSCLAAGSVMAREIGVFTDTQGRKITAELQMVRDGNITLKRSDGKVFTVPLEKLCEEDQAYALDWEERHASEMEELAAKVEAERLAAERPGKIASFCKENMGKQVGNGECWTLADEAFKACGAERPAGESRVWGRLVDFGKEPIEPGDVVEFRAAQITGYGTTGPFHTAVVVKGGRRGQCTVAEQNWSGVKKVRETSLNLRGLVSGEVRVYRPE